MKLRMINKTTPAIRTVAGGAWRMCPHFGQADPICLDRGFSQAEQLTSLPFTVGASSCVWSVDDEISSLLTPALRSSIDKMMAMTITVMTKTMAIWFIHIPNHHHCKFSIKNVPLSSSLSKWRRRKVAVFLKSSRSLRRIGLLRGFLYFDMSELHPEEDCAIIGNLL